MPEQANGGIEVTLDGGHLRVDARPARLVSLLKGGGGGDPVVTARPFDGPAHTESLPRNARRATFRIRDDVTVEATRAADFVAIADETGRCLVVAFSGEVTVVPRGDDRFALGAHEALVVPAGKGDPRVVSTVELSDADQAELNALLDTTADAVLAPVAPPPAPAPATEPVVPVPKPEPESAAPKPAAAAAGKVAPEKVAPAKATPAKKAGVPAAVPVGQTGGQRRKKGKKGRPQPARPQKTAAAKKAATTTKAAAKVAAGGPTKPPTPPARGGGGGGGGGGAGGGGHDDDVYEDTPRDRRFLVVASIGALLLAVILVVVLTGNDDNKSTIATDTTTTTAEPAATTTTAKPAATTTTTAKSAATTTAQPTTTSKATTTTGKATTTTAATVAPNYSIEPKSCVQSGNSITYTATITNKASVPFDFTVTVVFKDTAGAQVASADASVAKLGSSRSADFSAKGTSTKSLAGTGASCEVTKVDARASK